MERLTERFDDGILKGILVKEKYGEHVPKTLFEEVDEGYLGMCVLKAYEDTGIAPEQIEELLSRENTLEITRSPRDNDGWIPVDDRLPEEYGEYLVTIVPSAGYLWAKRIIANFSDLMGIVKKPIFYTGEVGKIDFEDITDMVIAWRPLPEPYRPERSSDEKE